MAADTESAMQSSLTDMMTSLMVIFVLLLVNYLKEQKNEKQQEVKATSHQIEEVRGELTSALEQQFVGVQVKKDPNDPLSISVIIPEDYLLFEKNKALLSERGKGFLSTFTPQFLGVTCDEHIMSDVQSVVIEGHTDSDRPVDKPFFNLELSQRRSLEVLTFMIQNAGDSNRDCFLDRAAASGRGEREPILVNGDEDKDKSRRVVLKIRMKSEREEEFQNALREISPTAEIVRDLTNIKPEPN